MLTTPHKMRLFLLLFSFVFVLQTNSQIIITAAGTPAIELSGGDGGQFANATFNHAGRMIYDKAGNLYIGDVRTGSIRRVDAATGIITTFVSGFYLPEGMAFDPQEKVMYLATNRCVYQIDMSTRVVSVFAGTPGQSCTYYPACGEGGPATSAILDNPGGVAVDSAGNVYIADNGDSRVRKVDIKTGIITTYAGGAGCNCVGDGDGGPASQSTLLFPSDVLFDNNKDLIISDPGLHTIRKVNSKTGIINTIAGLPMPLGYGYSGDGGPAVNARIQGPQGLFIDKDNNLFFAEAANSIIRKIDKAGIISTVAGNGTAGYSGDCGPPLRAQLNTPVHAVISPNGTMYISDYYNNVIRAVINGVPNVITASANGICVNSTIIVKDSAQGGVWQSSNTNVASVSAAGVVTGLTPGKAEISYYVVNGCNSGASTITIMVYASPVVSKIAGPVMVCEGSAINLTDTAAGGSWTSSDTSVAYANANGVIIGIKAGSAIIQYTVSNGYCSSRDSVKITVNPLPVLSTISGDTSVCVNGTTILTNAKGGGRWNIDNTAVAIIDPVSGLLKGISAGIATVTYTINNNCGFASVHTGIKVKSLPYFSLGNDTAVCLNSKLLLQPVITNVSYLWEDGSKSMSHLVSMPGIYYLQVTDSNRCTFSDTINIQNKPLPHVYLGKDTSLCNNLTLTLNASDTSVQRYSWQDGTTSSYYFVKNAGAYIVTVTGYNGCMNRDSINVSYMNSPVVSLGGNQTICMGTSIILDPHLNNVTYLWQDGSTHPSFTVTQPGFYSVSVTNACGTATSNVAFTTGLCRLLMPDAFTPNNDGVNDVFGVKYPGFIKTFSLRIFNRWGELIFETRNPSVGWNGKYKGIDQEKGVYTWTITLTDLQDNPASGKGSVLLIR